MTEISHFNFYETFDTQIEDLPEELQNKFYRAIIKYGLYGEIPEFENPLEMALFKQFRFAIDNQRSKSDSYKGNINASKNKRKQTETNENKRKQTETNENKPKQTETNENKPKQTETKKTEEEYEYENEYEEEGEEERKLGAETPNFSPPLSEHQEKYARAVFELWKDAGLPCCKADFWSFCNKDFKLSLQYLKGIHSDDVIQAARNFTEMIKSPETELWWKQTQQKTFDSFCKGGLLRQFLPENFRSDNYKRVPRSAEDFKRAKAEREDAERAAKSEAFMLSAPKVCGNCGTSLEVSQAYGTAECHGCGAWYELKHGKWVFFENEA